MAQPLATMAELPYSTAINFMPPSAFSKDYPYPVCILTQEEYLKQDPTLILPNVYQSSMYWQANHENLHQAGITAIVNCGESIMSEPRYKHAEYFILDWQDSNFQSIVPDVEMAYQFIANQLAKNNKVLVHCAAGASRSTAVLLYFLMRHFYYSLNDSVTHCKKLRSLCNPRHHFLNQLRLIEPFVKTVFGPRFRLVSYRSADDPVGTFKEAHVDALPAASDIRFECSIINMKGEFADNLHTTRLRHIETSDYKLEDIAVLPAAKSVLSFVYF